MIVGVGLDIAEIDRIEHSLERFGKRFLHRILAPGEHRGLPRIRQAQYVAVRFAAKEAAVKALGTGFSLGIGFHDLEVVKNPAGKPDMILHGPALERMRTIGGKHAVLSLTHAQNVAAAVVVIEN